MRLHVSNYNIKFSSFTARLLTWNETILEEDLQLFF